MSRDSKPDPSAAAEVFFDGGCPLCRREIAAYRRLDGMRDVHWCDVADPSAVPQGLDRDAALARFHVRREDGRIISGAAAFLAVWRRNPQLRPLAVALDRPPFRPVLEGLYRVFLRVRPLLR